jgi:chromosome segregation ATPase
MADTLASLMEKQREVVETIGGYLESIAQHEKEIKKVEKKEPNHPALGQWRESIKTDEKNKTKAEAKLKKINSEIQAMQAKIEEYKVEKKEIEGKVRGLGDSIKQHQKELKKVDKNHPAFKQWTSSIETDEKNMKKQTVLLKKINDKITKLAGGSKLV